MNSKKDVARRCVTRLVRLLDSCCMGAPGDDPQVIVIKQGVTGIIVGLILGIPMVLFLSWLLNTLGPLQVPNVKVHTPLPASARDEREVKP